MFFRVSDVRSLIVLGLGEGGMGSSGAAVTESTQFIEQQKVLNWLSKYHPLQFPLVYEYRSSLAFSGKVEVTILRSLITPNLHGIRF